ncbi:paternally-expressed gene 3 protein isoform X2 [Heterocephalus glaber]|nr:paternally-expressed gene 3 protein isoform X2 [Heterocephalus glaber]
MADTSFEVDSSDGRDTMGMDWEAQLQNAQFYQHVMSLYEDRKPQNTIQDNMESYRKLLSLGMQLAEDYRHSHMTQGHSLWGNRDAYPSTSQGLHIVPEAIKSAQQQGVCKDESSCGMIMENLIKEMSHGPKAGRARESSEGLQEFGDDWKDASCGKTDSAIQGRGFEGNSFRGGFRFTSNLVSRKKVLERKRCCHFDADGKAPVRDHRGCARKKPLECGGETREAVSVSNLSSLSCAPASESQPVDLGVMPYLCEECGRSFAVVSEFVEHQILHTRENLYEYGESFMHSVAVSEVRSSGGECLECKECGEACATSSALAEHCKTHAREYFKECKGQDSEGTQVLSPTFSALQKIYGQNKFYECKVCKETFLHSSALMEHQKTHGRGDVTDDRDGECWPEREGQRRESLLPCSSLHGFQKMDGKEKIHKCEVCGESFLHSSPLKEHQKIHLGGNPFENKSELCEETPVPGQSLRRRQNTSPQDSLFDFTEGRVALVQSPDLGEGQKIHSRKNFFKGKGYEKPVTHRGPSSESQKSHTLSRPPEDEDKDEEEAFTISSSPHEDRKFPLEENVLQGKPYEKSVVFSTASADAQKRPTVGLRRPKLPAESPLQSSDVINCQKVYAPGDACEGKGYKRPIVHGWAAPTPLKCPRGNEQVECGEKGESSMYLSDLHNKWQGIPTREHPCEGDKNTSYKGYTMQSAPHTEPQRSRAGGGAGEFKPDGKLTIPSSNVREHQKARAKRKYIEPRSNETSALHSLLSGELPTVCAREKLCGRQECGESFACSSDLAEHQKIHNGEKPCGSRNYERSAIHNFSPADPQTSYTQEHCTEEQACNKPRELGPGSAASSNLDAHQTADAQEKPHGEEPHGQETRGDPAAQASELDEPDGTVYERQDCGLDFAALSDLRGHQDVQSRKRHVDSCESGHPEVHTHSVSKCEKVCSGEQLDECPKRGEPFLHSSFLFKHQRIHEQDQSCTMEACDDNFISLSPVKPQRNRAIGRNPGLAIRCSQCTQGFLRSSTLDMHTRHLRDDKSVEQSERPEIFCQGHALTELPGSETREKLMECLLCEESVFTPRELGDHHRKVHKDEPHEYQPSDTRASLLTRPLRKPKPFFECKDCGQPFIPDTDLTGHHGFYPEEATTAQEAEADVLIPQEALQIQGSNADAAEPGMEVAEPGVEAAEASGEAKGPDEEATEPSGEAEAQPTGDADEPDGAGIEDPEESSREPEGDADEPDGAGIADPEEGGADPEVWVEGSYYSCPECAEIFLSSTAFGEHLQIHARVVILEPANALGHCSGYMARARQAGQKPFRCGVCGQPFGHFPPLARHQNTHRRECRGWRAFT